MAVTYKVLGQSNPSATSATTLYTVPGATSAIVSSIVVCNQAAASATFRVAVRPAGAGLAAQHYLYYDVALAGNATFAATLGIPLATTDVVTVYASTATMSFNLFGNEIV